MSDWFDDGEGPHSEVEAGNFADQESYPVLPICLTIDVSGSMQASGAIEAVNTCLPELRAMVLADPTIGEMAKLSIVTFENTARTVVESQDIRDITFPHLIASGGTNYTAGLREGQAAIERAIRQLGRGVRIFSPVMFFISDGEPNDAEPNWFAAREQLSQMRYRPNVVAFGMGDANLAVISKLATKMSNGVPFAFLARDTDPVAATREVFKQIIGSIKVTSASARTAAANGGDIVFGMDQSVTEQFSFLMPGTTMTT
jgi:uncharacterized protein YegL